MNSSVTILHPSSASQPGRINSCFGGAGGGDVDGECSAAGSRREELLGVRMNSSRPEGGDDGGDGSTLRRFAVVVAVVLRGLRSGGAGLASHGSVRGIWVCGWYRQKVRETR